MADDTLLPHFSYLLRVWAVDLNGDIGWRASLESPQTGERLGFADLAALFAFLRRTTASARDGRATVATQRTGVG